MLAVPDDSFLSEASSGRDPSLAPESPSREPPDAVPSPLDDDLALALDLRSFFAQPLPLNTIVGGAKALRIDPSVPHSGQKFGPGSWTPCRMSAR